VQLNIRQEDELAIIAQHLSPSTANSFDQPIGDE
jgi:hypothetical protein